MKKINGLLLAGASILVLASCGGKKGESIKNIAVPNVTLTDNVVSWDAVEHAKGYIVKINDVDMPIQTETTYTLDKEGTFKVSVKAVSENVDKWYSSSFSTELNYSYSLSSVTVWVVGDSTVCDYGKYDEDGNKTGVTDTSYYYDRYGYATQFSEYFNTKVTVKNLALSGRSARSFIIDENKDEVKNATNEEKLALDYNDESLYTANYKKLVSEIKSGDYLVIGFGHNDEKFDDCLRFSDASKSTNTLNSFKNILYEKYIKMAQNKGATPVLNTPIVRYTDTLDFTGKNGHKLTLEDKNIAANGTTTLAGHSAGDILDYRQAILDLGEEKNVQTIDLTTLSGNVQTELGADNAKHLHAVTKGVSTDSGKTVTPDFSASGLDETHINIFGAKMYAYEFAKALKATRCALGDYVKSNIVAPTEANDLVVNPYYEYVEYSAADWSTYEAGANFTTITEGWYGTTFGSNGGTSKHVAKETTQGVFEVGSTTAAGKISSTVDGFGYVFTQIPVSKNFTVSVKGTIKSTVNTTGVQEQSGFGLMLRDDCYLPSKVDVSTNYVASGVLVQSSGTYFNWKRESTALGLSENTTTHAFVAGDEIEFSITRVGQTVTCVTTYNGTAYSTIYTDFDFVATDSDYMYVGMFANRGTVVTFTNLNFQITGDSQGA